MPEDGTCVYFCAVFSFACMRFEHNSYLDAFSYGDGETCNGAGATVVYNNTIYSPTGNISVSAVAYNYEESHPSVCLLGSVNAFVFCPTCVFSCF